jgi:hypothetical protein
VTIAFPLTQIAPRKQWRSDTHHQNEEDQSGEVRLNATEALGWRSPRFTQGPIRLNANRLARNAGLPLAAGAPCLASFRQAIRVSNSPDRSTAVLPAGIAPDLVLRRGIANSIDRSGGLSGLLQLLGYGF